MEELHELTGYFSLFLIIFLIITGIFLERKLFLNLKPLKWHKIAFFLFLVVWSFHALSSREISFPFLAGIVIVFGGLFLFSLRYFLPSQRRFLLTVKLVLIALGLAVLAYAHITI